MNKNDCDECEVCKTTENVKYYEKSNQNWCEDCAEQIACPKCGCWYFAEDGLVCDGCVVEDVCVTIPMPLMPEPMRKCSCCKVECVREFGAWENFKTADGVEMRRYLICDSMVFCDLCDWKLNQVLLGNILTWGLHAHEFTNEQLVQWGISNNNFPMLTEVKRLARNAKQREKRAIAKQENGGKKPISYAEKEKRKAKMENSDEWKTMKAELEILKSEVEKKNAILYEPIPLIYQKINANLNEYGKIFLAREKILEEKFGL